MFFVYQMVEKTKREAIYEIKFDLKWMLKEGLKENSIKVDLTD